MRTMKLVSGAAALACLIGSASFAQAPDGAGTNGVKGGRREEVLKRFDKDGDGKLDPSERAALRTALKERLQAGKGRPKEGRALLLKKFDRDGDGKLDMEERAAARRAAVRKAGGPDRQKIQAMRAKIRELQGKVRAEEQKLGALGQKVRQKRAQVLKKFDKDGDGKLNQEERSALREGLRARRSTATRSA